MNIPCPLCGDHVSVLYTPAGTWGAFELAPRFMRAGEGARVILTTGESRLGVGREMHHTDPGLPELAMVAHVCPVAARGHPGLLEMAMGEGATMPPPQDPARWTWRVLEDRGRAITDFDDRPPTEGARRLVDTETYRKTVEAADDVGLLPEYRSAAQYALIILRGDVANARRYIQLSAEAELDFPPGKTWLTEEAERLRIVRAALAELSG